MCIYLEIPAVKLFKISLVFKIIIYLVDKRKVTRLRNIYRHRLFYIQIIHL